MWEVFVNLVLYGLYLFLSMVFSGCWKRFCVFLGSFIWLNWLILVFLIWGLCFFLIMVRMINFIEWVFVKIFNGSFIILWMLYDLVSCFKRLFFKVFFGSMNVLCLLFLRWVIVLVMKVVVSEGFLFWVYLLIFFCCFGGRKFVIGGFLMIVLYFLEECFFWVFLFSFSCLGVF